MKKYIILIVFFVFLTPIFSNPFEEGVELFKNNRVEEALYLFEEALITDPSVDVYKYLAESYNILALHDDETLVLEEALTIESGEEAYFNFKLGNAYYLIEDYRNALNSYLKVLEINKGFVNETFLNIANVSVDLELYSSAIDNYTKYLELEPDSTQKRKIIKMIFYLKKLHKEQLAQIEVEQKLAEEERMAAELANRKLEEDKLTELNEMESERERRARELEEQRLQYESAEQSLLDDIEAFKIDEEAVVDPPDPDIEARRDELAQREEDLNERETQLSIAEQELKDAEAELEKKRQELMESNVQMPDGLEYTDSQRVKTEEELAAEAAEKARLEEQARQEAIMNDILSSLEKIGENAKGINAGNEEAYDELEGSDIDE